MRFCPVSVRPPYNLLYMLLDEIYCNSVLSPSGHYDISIFLGGNAKFLKSWLDQCCVLVKNVLQISSPLLYITQNSPEQLDNIFTYFQVLILPCKTGIRISINKQLDIKHVSHFCVVEN